MADVKEAWVEYDAIKFPKDVTEFDGYVIATFIVREVIVVGVKKRAIYAGQLLTLKGNIPSLSPCFRYRLRFRPETRAQQQQRQSLGVEDYEILPMAGFVSALRLPWNFQRLAWCVEWEMHVHVREDIHRYLQAVLDAMTEDDRARMTATTNASNTVNIHGMLLLSSDAWLTDDDVKHLPCYDRWSQVGDVFRMEFLLIAKHAWPNHLSAIRTLDAVYLEKLTDFLKHAPHQLAFEVNSKQFSLPEMSYAGLLGILQSVPETQQVTKRLHKGAVHLYRHLKTLRKSWSHTVFAKDSFLRYYKQNDAGSEYSNIADAALNWLVGEGHLLYIDGNGLTVKDKRAWFAPESPARFIQTPRDVAWKEKIVCHLRRICANFIVAKGGRGAASWRHVTDEITAVPKGRLNAQQRKAMAHIMNNPITIVQGGPGSGKTFMCVEHLAAIFEWPEFVTHVGRQAVSLCDRLGGNPDSATTIHSAHSRQKRDYVRVAYNACKQILVLDEVYNGTERELEWALSLVPEASRVVFVGDPNQIRPISDEPAAGTPALDIARAFPEHTIVLTENMRQQEGARAIHAVVEYVLRKQDDRIAWESDLSLNANTHAVRLASPATHGGKVDDALRQSLFKMIKRLRHGIPRGDEHAWQLVTFYNGNKPDMQGLGCKQLNEVVEAYLQQQQQDRTTGSTGVAASKERVAITNRLTMYAGYKFMFTEKGSVQNPAALNQKIIGKNNRGPLHDTKNGQIEVVKEVRAVRISGFPQGSKFWLVVCQPKGKNKEGTRFIINKKIHVDPSHIQSAWAITTDKSMGGECTNVGVYIPPGIERSMFDRSNLYVAVSRPMEFLCVMGEPRDIHALAMKDPPHVRTGLQLRLAAATLYPHEWQQQRTNDDDDDANQRRRENETLSGASSGALEEVMKRTDWKRAHDIAGSGFLNYQTLEQLGLDIFDQTGRTRISNDQDDDDPGKKKKKGKHDKNKDKDRTTTVIPSVCPESFAVFKAKMRKTVEKMDELERLEHAAAIEKRALQKTYCFMEENDQHEEDGDGRRRGAATTTTASERPRNDNSAATKRQRIQMIQINNKRKS